jgi:hypothetical protein
VKSADCPVLVSALEETVMFLSTLRHLLRGCPRPKRAVGEGDWSGFTYGKHFIRFVQPEDQRLPGRHRARAAACFA